VEVFNSPPSLQRFPLPRYLRLGLLFIRIDDLAKPALRKDRH
jgi:hypothetical protein